GRWLRASRDLASLRLFFRSRGGTTRLSTLSLHDALPICAAMAGHAGLDVAGIELREARLHAVRVEQAVLRAVDDQQRREGRLVPDRKSTRLNSSHDQNSYAVFCLKKKTDMPTPLCVINGA